MINFKISTAKLNLALDKPSRKFWQGIALEAAKTVRKRTEAGNDLEGNKFKSYTAKYEAFRVKHGRSRTPNLTYSGKMLGAFRTKAYTDGAKVTVSGSEGLKAWANEQRGREFFDLNDNEFDSIVKKIDLWLKRRNQLK